MKKIRRIVFGLSIFITVRSAQIYDLAIHTAHDYGLECHKIESLGMKFLTTIDILRAINVGREEKLSCLPVFVDLSFTFCEAISACAGRAEDGWIELTHLMRDSFDDLYDMLLTDEIACVRVLLRKATQALIAPGGIKPNE